MVCMYVAFVHPSVIMCYFVLRWATEKFRRISEAYQILSDADRRLKYDSHVKVG
jgi:hypothetical protein